MGAPVQEEKTKSSSPRLACVCALNSGKRKEEEKSRGGLPFLHRSGPGGERSYPNWEGDLSIKGGKVKRARTRSGLLKKRMKATIEPARKKEGPRSCPSPLAENWGKKGGRNAGT